MIESHRPLGEAICQRLTTEINKLGFPPTNAPPAKPVYADAQFETSRDPFSGEDTLCASWHDTNGHRVGEMKFHADGSFFAEYDVVMPHPKDPRWFVEGVAAWGRGETIKSEPKLLPAIGP